MPTRCNIQLPPVPLPPVTIPLGPTPTALALLAAIQAAMKTLRQLPIPGYCPLD